MLKKLIASILLTGFAGIAFAQNPSYTSRNKEFKIITILESIVPMGIGRSVIIDNQKDVDAKEFTTTRTEQNRSGQQDIRRKDIRIKDIEETKLLNFYSLPGINIENIASNDAMITSKINNMLEQGWTLEFVTSGVESDSGKDDGKGIFITRLFFTR